MCFIAQEISWGHAFASLFLYWFFLAHLLPPSLPFSYLTPIRPCSCPCLVPWLPLPPQYAFQEWQPRRGALLVSPPEWQDGYLPVHSQKDTHTQIGGKRQRLILFLKQRGLESALKLWGWFINQPSCSGHTWVLTVIETSWLGLHRLKDAIESTGPSYLRCSELCEKEIPPALSALGRKVYAGSREKESIGMREEG
jgi:hypothetical protein